MMHAAKKFMVTSGIWATVVTSIVTAALLAGGAYVWNANADMAVLQSDVKAIKEANLPNRLTRMEEQMKAASDTAQRIEFKQGKMDDKIDVLLTRK